MSFNTKLTLSTLLLGLSSSVYAHMTVVSEDASAGWYYTAAVGVPHGCKDPASTKGKKLPNWDTYKVEVNVPKTFKKPRPFDNLFGTATVTETANNYVLTWNRHDNYPEYSTDTHAYALQFKTKLPKGDFVTHYFPSTQYCHKDGVETKAEWVNLSSGHSGKPAPKLVAYPKGRHAGWNNFITKKAIDNLAVFKNAQIVWYGDEAYSSNKTTSELIKKDSTVNTITSIPSGASIWVKY